jgi:glycosyltransferase involved in cell wall biosynthesis
MRKYGLTVIVPVYNERHTVEKVLKEMARVDLSGLGISTRVVIVDDGSTDGSGELLEKLRGKYGFTLVRHARNGGKGSAIRTALKKADGDFVLIQDADLEYPPTYYPALLKPLVDGEADVVYGSRFLMLGRMYWLHLLGNKLLTLFTNVLYGARITDMETGYKAFRLPVLKGIPLESRGFEIEPEITAKVLRKGIKILEVPIRFKARGFDEGKKITWKDGLRALAVLVRLRFS